MFTIYENANIIQLFLDVDRSNRKCFFDAFTFWNKESFFLNDLQQQKLRNSNLEGPTRFAY